MCRSIEGCVFGAFLNGAHFLICGGMNMELKVNAKGNICIPKRVCEKEGFLPGVSYTCHATKEGIIIKPRYTCSRCAKPLADELKERGACLTCEPRERKIIELY